MIDLSKSLDFFDPLKLKDKDIHIIGCGAIGSNVAINLARLGITNLRLWDFDTVTPHNIANQAFTFNQIGAKKVDAVEELVKAINPSIEVTKNDCAYEEGDTLNGFIFLAVDNIDVRRMIVETNLDNPYIEAMFDFRMRLEDAQAYAADWSNAKHKKAFLKSMNFTTEEAKAETPVSACGTTLSVISTVQTIVAVGVSNFISFCNRKPINTLVVANPFKAEYLTSQIK